MRSRPLTVEQLAIVNRLWDEQGMSSDIEEQTRRSREAFRNFFDAGVQAVLSATDEEVIEYSPARSKEEWDRRGDKEKAYQREMNAKRNRQRAGEPVSDGVERLTRDRDDAIRSRDTHKAWNHTAERERDAANVKVERLREALVFYADPATYHSRRAQNADPITLDSGQRARAALDAAGQAEGRAPA